MAEASASKSSPETGSKGGGSGPSGPLSKYKSKKQSATGFWENDGDVHCCRKCEAKFSFTVRKHHCRMCGRIFCGSCCNNQILMEELSRSGKPKRVCDWCFAHERGLDEADKEEETEESMGDLRVSEKQTSTSSHEEGTTVSESPHEAARAAHGIQEISMEEAVEALNHVQFSGNWLITLTFHVVDMKNSPNVGPPLKAAPADAFRGPAPAARGGKKPRRSTRPETTLKPGSHRRAVLELYPKGKAYFRGVCRDLAPFGKDGKITGSIQRMNGQVSTQMQLKSSNGVTTSFNLIGRMNKDGHYIGSFSGCEIAKSAGAVSGTFQAAPMEEEESSDDASSDNDRPKGKSTATRRTSATAPRKSSTEEKHRRSSARSSKDEGDKSDSHPKKSSQESDGEPQPDSGTAESHTEDTSVAVGADTDKQETQEPDKTEDTNADTSANEASNEQPTETGDNEQAPEESTAIKEEAGDVSTTVEETQEDTTAHEVNQGESTGNEGDKNESTEAGDKEGEQETTAADTNEATGNEDEQEASAKQDTNEGSAATGEAEGGENAEQEKPSGDDAAESQPNEETNKGSAGEDSGEGADESQSNEQNEGNATQTEEEGSENKQAASTDDAKAAEGGNES
eukprot:gb/GECG01003172.1/.p1 GENE.gb/GECG01003172.1/~~gb/GECG01003172.1/.p1  ORF type:complete len:626 (+),score=144.66 gb/GECG01003172.1/:1-1878(+)